MSAYGELVLLKPSTHISLEDPAIFMNDMHVHSKANQTSTIHRCGHCCKMILPGPVQPTMVSSMYIHLGYIFSNKLKLMQYVKNNRLPSKMHPQWNKMLGTTTNDDEIVEDQENYDTSLEFFMSYTSVTSSDCLVILIPIIMSWTRLKQLKNSKMCLMTLCRQCGSDCFHTDWCCLKRRDDIWCILPLENYYSCSTSTK